MSVKVNVLVTGCGGDIGQSIGKILKEIPLINNIYGIDISSKNAGSFIYPNFKVGLPIKHPDFFQFLNEFIKTNKIDLYIPMAEPELRHLTQVNRLDFFGQATMIHANRLALEIGFDKLKTSEFLQQHGLPFPKTHIASDYVKMNLFPFILKSRSGSGGKNLYLINDRDDISYLQKKVLLENYIVQEFLTQDSDEYTCGLFRSKAGEIRSIIFRRELTGGYSGFGEVIESEPITLLLNSIAQNINLQGSINVQLRMISDVPYVFEINPRFSSTVRFRNMFGFNDVLWSIQDALNIKVSDYERHQNLSRFYKGFSEYVD
ncbi:MAG: ATP-grasp domain-containing protein [Cytophagales bacterium]|jgi:carbamoyl-phosphate synthase large subunit|nr:ATP-grasp domain-containing protein [Cytophagales bacterium]MCA6388888.1 ATP-grasp domain-containing protein [Cytophagales bacterium]MCA6391118.1 ATP-grasp domain-containing protein [Cytophagales bacterium]MCA6397737.1 ATP-grasp domain-containing protein [Cytophagales bacterium]MCA6401428.1 ATP-grasp domain-containing protein [Cytophagales bacterium]